MRRVGHPARGDTSGLVSTELSSAALLVGHLFRHWLRGTGRNDVPVVVNSMRWRLLLGGRYMLRLLLWCSQHGLHGSLLGWGRRPAAALHLNALSLL